MNAAKVYKINVRNNVLRQVIFTDTNIFFILIAAVIAFIWKLAEATSIEFRIFCSFIIAGLIMLLFTTKIDRQPIPIVLLRIIKYFITKRRILC